MPLKKTLLLMGLTVAMNQASAAEEDLTNELQWLAKEHGLTAQDLHRPEVKKQLKIEWAMWNALHKEALAQPEWKPQDEIEIQVKMFRKKLEIEQYLNQWGASVTINPDDIKADFESMYPFRNQGQWVQRKTTQKECGYEQSKESNPWKDVERLWAGWSSSDKKELQEKGWIWRQEPNNNQKVEEGWCISQWNSRRNRSKSWEEAAPELIKNRQQWALDLKLKQLKSSLEKIN